MRNKIIIISLTTFFSMSLQAKDWKVLFCHGRLDTTQANDHDSSDVAFNVQIQEARGENLGEVKETLSSLRWDDLYQGVVPARNGDFSTNETVKLKEKNVANPRTLFDGKYSVILKKSDRGTRYKLQLEGGVLLDSTQSKLTPAKGTLSCIDISE